MGRKEYWLKTIGSSLGLFLVGTLLTALADFFLIIYIIGAVVLWVVTLMWARLRFHDAGLSGAWLLLSLVPIVGNIAVFIILVLPANTFDSYGRVPSAPQQVEVK